MCPLDIANRSEARHTYTLKIRLAVYTGAKRRGYKAVYLAPSSAEIKNVQSRNSVPPYAFMVWFNDVQRKSCALPLIREAVHC